MPSSIHPSGDPRGPTLASRLRRSARGIFWLLAFGLMVVIPWSFGGNGPEGYYWIMWSGRLCLLPLALWAVACGCQRKLPGWEFWVPVVSWGLLAVQVIASLQNPSHESEPPWVGEGFIPIQHHENLPSTAFDGGTISDGHLWLAFALLALTARCVGIRRRPLRALLWAFVGNATILALIGVPFKFSGEAKILGLWEVQEKYFYSTFLYHNHWCAYALLALASAAGLFETAAKQSARIALAVAGLVIAASAPLSTSRLGTLAMLAFGLFVVATVFRRSRRKPTPSSPTRFAAGLIAGAVLAAALIAGSAVYFYKARSYTPGDRQWTTILRGNPFGLRQTFVEDTIPMLQKKPWFGWGLGAYGAAFRFYQRPETRIVHNQGRVTLYDHIHDDWLERLAELGVVGFALFTIPGMWWLNEIRRQRPLASIQLWLTAGCGAVLLFAFGDMAFANWTVSAVFGVMLGLATKGEERG